MINSDITSKGFFQLNNVFKSFQVQVNVNPNPAAASNGLHSDGDAPEIRKYKKKFSGDVR